MAPLQRLMLALTIMICLGACAPKHSSYSSFRSIPHDGWNKTLVLKFTPKDIDSTLRYDVNLAVRHSNSYEFSNLSLTVDIIDSNGKLTRKPVDFEIADRYGNWKGSGFGALYQCSSVIATGLTPNELRGIVVWQSMKGQNVVHNVTDVGITLTPTKSK